MSNSNLITPIDSQFFEKIKNNPGIYLLDFWADWCGPCKMMNPVLENLAVEMEGSVTFLSVDVDVEQQLSEEFGITAMPTFYLIKMPGDGTFEVERDTITVMRGAAPALDFKIAIEKALQNV
jgi:thioredoxin 1